VVKKLPEGRGTQPNTGGENQRDHAANQCTLKNTIKLKKKLHPSTSRQPKGRNGGDAMPKEEVPRDPSTGTGKRFNGIYNRNLGTSNVRSKLGTTTKRGVAAPSNDRKQ